MTIRQAAARRRVAAAVCALGLAPAVTVVVTTGGPAAHAGTCTIRGTAGPDRLVGTGGRDWICGLGGDDVLIGGGGGDHLDGGSGNDVLSGGDGADFLVGGAGADRLDGQGGNDQMRWEAGADRIRGGAGADFLTYVDAPRRVVVTLDGAANDGTVGEGDLVADDVERVLGSKYADRLTGDAEVNRLEGFDGRDRVVGGGGNDALEGGNEDDEIHGGPGDDRLVGADGADLMTGGPGADRMQGEGGNTPDQQHENVCDKDPADTVLLCTRDGEPPLFYAYDYPPRVAPGQTLTFGEGVLVDDLAGVYSVDLRTTFGGAPVPWCSGTMDLAVVLDNGTVRRADLDCDVPAGAPEGAYEMEFEATDRLGFTGVSTTRELFGFMVDTTAESGPPTVGDVTTSKASYAAGEWVRVTIEASDPSGVEQVDTSLRPSSGSFLCPDGYSPRTGGSMVDGTFSFACKLGPSVPPGTWAIDVDARDTYGNTVSASGAATFTVTP